MYVIINFCLLRRQTSDLKQPLDEPRVSQCFFSLCILLDKDSDFELSEELSNEDSVSEGDDSDFDGETELKKTKKAKGRGKSTTSSPAKPNVKPRTSVTGGQIN